VDLKAFISGCAGLALDDAERHFFAATRPCGLILFRRNCGSPAQIRTLIADFTDAVGSDEVLVVIDQEGGRVERLKPPHWRHMPPALLWALYDRSRNGRAAAFAGGLTAELTISASPSTMPVLDVPQKARMKSSTPRLRNQPETVIAL
jgi:beta-N-acetylhexosaminidase